MLKRELAEIRKNGYALCRQELGLGLESVAAPIFTGNRVEAAISVNLPRLHDENSGELERVLRDRVLELSRELSMK